MLQKWRLEAHTQKLQVAGLPLPPAKNSCRNLPWEGITKIGLAFIAICTSIFQSSISPFTVMIISMYVMFIISGLVDVFLFYCGYSIFPEGIQSFILAASFFGEAICYHALSSEDTDHWIFLLLFLILSCSFASLLEVVFDNRLIKFCRSFFTLFQSSWLLHLNFLLEKESDVSPLWISIFFTWHFCSLFTLTIVLLLIMHYFARPGSSPPLLDVNSINECEVSNTGSASQLVPCKFLKVPLASSLEPPDSMFQTISRATGGNTSTRAPSVIDVEPWDRVQRFDYTSFQKA